MHADGQIWSQALWEIRGDYVALGKTTRAWDTTLIDAQFDFAVDTSFSAAAKATYDAALARDGQAGGERGQGPVRRPRHHVLSVGETSP